MTEDRQRRVAPALAGGFGGGLSRRLQARAHARIGGCPWDLGSKAALMAAEQHEMAAEAAP